MRILLVDDEPLARRRLRRLLRDLPGTEVIGEAADGESARGEIQRLAPDLVLLDIAMPGLDGLSLAAEGHAPAIVFVTAHTEHALAAFEAAAVDYLVKPVEPERLARALERVRTRSVPRIVTTGAGATHQFDAREVARFWASDKYTAFRHAGREHLTEESLVQLEARLASHGFVRVHRGELVALARIRTLEGDVAVLDDGDRARVSRRLVADLRRRLARR